MSNKISCKQEQEHLDFATLRAPCNARPCITDTSIGTIHSYQHGPEYREDGLSSDDVDDQEGKASDDEVEIELKSSAPDDFQHLHTTGSLAQVITRI